MTQSLQIKYPRLDVVLGYIDTEYYFYSIVSKAKVDCLALFLYSIVSKAAVG